MNQDIKVLIPVFNNQPMMVFKSIEPDGRYQAWLEWVKPAAHFIELRNQIDLIVATPGLDVRQISRAEYWRNRI